jgi:peptidoglycan/LPS O-acetylase OafA/YrhL
VRGAVLSYREPPLYIDNLLAIRGLCALGVAVSHLIGASRLSFGWYLENGWEAGATSHAIFSALLPTTGKNFVLFFFVHSGYLMGKV